MYVYIYTTCTSIKRHILNNFKLPFLHRWYFHLHHRGENIFRAKNITTLKLVLSTLDRITTGRLYFSPHENEIILGAEYHPGEISPTVVMTDRRAVLNNRIAYRVALTVAVITHGDNDNRERPRARVIRENYVFRKLRTLTRGA